jgi:hypothetical protein
MAYLMHIGFDNSSRLYRDTYYFEYKKVRYKLIQNDIKKWCDVLLTIVPGNNNKVSENIAYLTASEFISALSWENNSLAKVWLIGGAGVREDFTLKKAKCTIRTFPRVPFHGYTVGYDITCIPHVETEDQRNALILFREASSSNNYYLSFLFFWQIFEIGKNDPIGWINKAYRRKRNRIRLTNSDLNRLPLSGKSIGQYFYDDCRNAISHIYKRQAEKLRLKLDTPAENMRIALSTRVIKEFARFYIKNKLQLQHSMYLVRKKGRGFPVYVKDVDIRRMSCKIAYEKHSLQQIRKKKWH